MFRSQEDFAALWASLPVGTCLSFTNSFPVFSSSFPVAKAVMKALSLDESSEAIEKRRLALGEWIRELVLSESCMRSEGVLAALYRFVEVHSHGGPPGVTAKVSHEKMRIDDAFHRTVSESNGSSPLSFDATAAKFTAIPMLTESSTLFRAVPLLDIKAFPVSVQKMTSLLPFKVDAAGIKQKILGASIVPRHHNSDTSQLDMKQLTKDMSRDRIIVQGLRILGSHSSIDSILDICKKSIVQVLIHSGQLRVSSSGSAPSQTPSTASLEAAVRALNIDLSSLDTFCKRALHGISRTESAFLSHASLHEVILDTGNARQAASWTPVIVVPESQLADALLLRFSVKLRESSASTASVSSPSPSSSGAATHRATGSPAVKGPAANEWCVLCEGEASTVYRIMEPESMALLSQVRVTYLNTLFAMPSSHGNGGTTFSVKDGRSYIIISKETTTTERDWAHS